MNLFALLSVFVLFCLLLIYEKRRHQANLQQIPIRIHINGTRGKSSVARLIYAGLKAANYHVICKTTGSEAKLLNSESSKELTIKRGQLANINEQIKVVEYTAQCQADVLIVECMALKPELQCYSEQYLLQSTHGVITNCGPDHLDVMGPTELDVAKSLAGSTPFQAQLFSNERKYRQVLQNACTDRGSQLMPLACENQVTAQQMAQFNYLEHKENVALALTVCRSIGVSKELALQGMYKVPADKGAMQIYYQDYDGQQIALLNAFAANDPEATRKCWDQASHICEIPFKVMLVNCRCDRIERSEQLAQLAATLDDLSLVIILGTGQAHFIKAAVACNIKPDILTQPSCQQPQSILKHLRTHSTESALMVGVGNIKDSAGDLLEYFQRQFQVLSEVQYA